VTRVVTIARRDLTGAVSSLRRAGSCRAVRRPDVCVRLRGPGPRRSGRDEWTAFSAWDRLFDADLIPVITMRVFAEERSGGRSSCS